MHTVLDPERAAAADELTYIYANHTNYHLIALASESDYMARWVMSPSFHKGTQEQSRKLLLPPRGGLRPRAASETALKARALAASQPPPNIQQTQTVLAGYKHSHLCDVELIHP